MKKNFYKFTSLISILFSITTIELIILNSGTVGIDTLATIDHEKQSTQNNSSFVNNISFQVIRNNLKSNEAPKGDKCIYLRGQFDGAPWNSTKIDIRTFIFNNETNKYELSVNLYKGDVFSPFIDGGQPIKSLQNSYWLDLLEKNNLSCSTNGNFICNKDGQYKFEISYLVEQLDDPSFVWSEEIGSTIQYISNNFIEYHVDGHKPIVVTGQINGIGALINNQHHLMEYDEYTRQYVFRTYLKKGDHIQIWLDDKKQFVNCPTDDVWLNEMCEGIGVTIKNFDRRPQFKIQVNGYYEIGVGGNIENLDSANNCWRKHGGSYIKYLGENISTCYVLLGSKSNSKINAYLEGTDVKQYGLNGFDVKPVKFIEFCDDQKYGSFLKIEYDEALTNKIALTLLNEQEERRIEFIPKNTLCYILESGEYSEVFGETCEFLSYLSNCLSNKFLNGKLYGDYLNLSESQSKELAKKYNDLSNQARQILDNDVIISSFNNAGLASQIKYDVIASHALKVISQSKKAENKKIVIYSLIVVIIILMVFVLTFTFKKNKNSKRISAN